MKHKSFKEYVQENAKANNNKKKHAQADSKSTARLSTIEDFH